MTDRAPTPPPFDPAPGSIPTLDVPDPSGWRRLHLVGIGGAGMRGLARVLLASGVVVTGSDLKDSAGLEGLRALGATVFVGHSAEQVNGPAAGVAQVAGFYAGVGHFVRRKIADGGAFDAPHRPFAADVGHQRQLGQAGQARLDDLCEFCRVG